MFTHFRVLVVAVALAALGGVGYAQHDSTTYNVDPAHSSVSFHIKHAGVSWVHGRFNSFRGSFTLDEEQQLTDVKLTIDANSIDTAVAQRDTHLRSGDFFNVDKFPTIQFIGASVEYDDEGAAHATGKLSLHGQTHEVTLPVEVVGVGTVRDKALAGVHSDFTVQRSDFGMNYGIANGMIGDAVHLQVSLEGGAAGSE